MGKNHKKLTKSDIYNSRQKINIEKLKRELMSDTRLSEQLYKDLMMRFFHIIQSEPNLCYLEDPVVVIGDIHGQYSDLLNLLSSFENELSRIKALFLGDYVDRGVNSVEVIILLMAIKIEYPKNVIMIRGNHECRNMSYQYNFRTECLAKYNQQFFESMMEIFECLPLACIVNKRYFCVHGGISDKLLELKKMNSINRKRQIPMESDALCDFIWADPVDDDFGFLSGGKVKYNAARDCSIVFGSELVSQFLAINNLQMIIRGHEVFLEGYKAHWDKHPSKSPTVLTIFSAPNYCRTTGNKSAILRIEKNCFKIKQYEQKLSADMKMFVNFDAISWTLPEITDLLSNLVMHFMREFAKKNFPDFKYSNEKELISILLDYTYKQSSIKHTFTPIALMKSSKPKEAKQVKQLSEEQKIILQFSRSKRYYQESEKAVRGNI